MVNGPERAHVILRTHALENDSTTTGTLAAGKCSVRHTKSFLKAGPNEDACLALHLDDDHAILAVADGVGGHPLGEMASERQVTLLRDTLLDASTDLDNLRDPVLNAIESCNRQLLEEGKGSVTTVTVVEISHHQMRSYHVGDSSAILVGQRGRLRLQTISHSPVALGIEAGLLEPEAVFYSDERNIVLNLVGTQEMRIEMGPTLPMARFDTLLLCSDGLTDNLDIHDISSIICSGPLENCMDELHAHCQEVMHSEAGHPDDLSMLLYRRSR